MSNSGKNKIRLTSEVYVIVPLELMMYIECGGNPPVIVTNFAKKNCNKMNKAKKGSEEWAEQGNNIVNITPNEKLAQNENHEAKDMIK